MNYFVEPRHQTLNAYELYFSWLFTIFIKYLGSKEVKDIDDILNDDVEANKDKEQTTMNDFFANLKKGVVKTPTEYTYNKEGNNSREKENKDYI